ncbi:MAG: Gfo/Idh/MocA family oxidoreductase, partial [Candidatus Eisenbacteria bacterium]
VWARVPGVSSVVAFDPDPAARDLAAAAIPGLQFADSYEALLDRCDLLSIAAPTSVHAELALTALRAGRHVLVEKPMAVTPEEAEAMLAAARSAGRALLVGQIERFNPAVRAALPHLANPRFIEAHRLAPPVPRGIDVDVVLDLMIHDLDLALLATRSRIVEMHAVGVPVLTDKVDIANARLVFESGCVANITASRISREKVRKIRFFDRASYISIDCMNRTVEAYSLAPSAPGAAPDDWMTRIRPLAVVVDGTDPLESELGHFLALRDDPARSWEECATALEALRAAEAIGRLVSRAQPDAASLTV